MPPGNKFVSSNWVDRECVAGELGEQPGGKPWRDGSDPKGYPIQTGDGCLIDDYFVDGLPAGETTGPWDAQGKLDCCTNPLPPPRTEVDCGGGNFVCPGAGGVPTVLSATMTSLGSCPEFNDVAVEMLEVSPGRWEGQVEIAGKTLKWILIFCTGSAHGDFTDGVTFLGEIACVPGDTTNITGGTFATATCDPFEITVEGMLLDVFASCCFQLAGVDVSIVPG